MAETTFQTNPVFLSKLLEQCRDGEIQLPDFQRSWVWDEERIRSLIASISRAFPVGALMTLVTGGSVGFKPRPIEGAPLEADAAAPHALLLDGQQRVTSLYQVTIRRQVVATVTPRNKKVKRWFYLDILKSLDPGADREEAVVSIPEDRLIKTDFGREIVLDLSTPEHEYARLMFPLTDVFDWDAWQDGFDQHWREDAEKRETFRAFKRQVLENFKSYQVPVISLGRGTTKEAVCVVFEKVNTGGKALDAFELVTATYAAEGHELRKDWYGDAGHLGRHGRLSDAYRSADSKAGILAGVSNTDFLSAVSLFHTRERRQQEMLAGKTGKELPAVTGNRAALLSLPLTAYKAYEGQVEHGFLQAAKFLHMQHIYRVFDLPYQSQIVPLAAILAEIGDAWEHEANRTKLVSWYWNGVFGELYGSSVESRAAKDFIEVPAWLKGGDEPTTVTEAIFRADRLWSMRMRLSAAYKGVNALLMRKGAQDFRSGQHFDHTVFFGENVDIHHIFPQDWCKKNGIKPSVFDSIINKTPLSYRTNRIIGGVAPSDYLHKLEVGSAETPPIASDRLDVYLSSHLIDPALLRANTFDAFMADRQRRLLQLIEEAMGKSVYTGDMPDEGPDAEEEASPDEEAMVA
jgi:hypothetical protein